MRSLYFFFTILIICSSGASESFCSQSYESIFGYSNALVLPFGRAFIAHEFGIGFQIDFDRILSSYEYGETFIVYISYCTFRNIPIFAEKRLNHSDINTILIWGRLIGPEILSPKAITIKLDTKKLKSPSWKFIFPKFNMPGTYKVEILSIWINSMLNPESNKRGVHASNQGNVVHLGGIGFMRNVSGEPPNINDIRLNDGDPERQHAHVYGSPFNLTVRNSNSQTNSNKISTTLSHKSSLLPYCKTGHASGRWVYEEACKIYQKNISNIPIGHECQQIDITYNGYDYPAPVKSQISNMVWQPYECQLKQYVFEGNISSAAQCLLDANIGVIAGFGDSLGYEQRDYLQQHLGGRIWTDGNAQGWIDCDHWKVNHWLNDYINLAKCIQKQADKLLRQNSTLKTIVLFTNFNIQHAHWISTLEESVNHLKNQQKTHHKLKLKLEKRGIKLRCIWFSGVAVHGFRVPGLTLSRQEWFNEQANDILIKQGGWELLDAFNMTVGRSDGTTDGVHYRGGVARAISTVLMNMLCNQ